MTKYGVVTVWSQQPLLPLYIVPLEEVPYGLVRFSGYIGFGHLMVKGETPVPFSVKFSVLILKLRSGSKDPD